MPQSIQFRTGGSEFIGETEPLWDQQKAYHLKIDSIHPESIVDITFESRMQQLTDKAVHLLVVLAEDSDTGQVVGYGLGTINAAGLGEIDSVFVEESYRGQGIGTKLIRTILDWMEEKEARRIKIHVLEVNQQAFKLYRALGFETRQLEMLRRTPNQESEELASRTERQFPKKHHHEFS